MHTKCKLNWLCRSREMFSIEDRHNLLENTLVIYKNVSLNLRSNQKDIILTVLHILIWQHRESNVEVCKSHNVETTWMLQRRCRVSTSLS